ncbi:MAG TPA: hypothetical protein VFA92_18020 [Candidatus Binatia bacterium]|jgi:hypothetical protein|nr:hypothetical protein [Candidatus Binatia bacterium]
MAGRGILFAQMDPAPELESEFNDWYEKEHVPERMAIEGFRSATRYRAREGDLRYGAVYDLDSLDVLESEAYRSVSDNQTDWTRRVLGSIRASARYTATELADSGPVPPVPVLLVVAFDVPPEEHAALDEWYETEHTELLMQVPGWLRVRRYLVQSARGGTWTHLALHDLASLDVLDRPERSIAHDAPGRKELSQRPWFNPGRWIYEVISRAPAD